MITKNTLPNRRISLDITIPQVVDKFFPDQGKMSEVLYDALLIYTESQQDMQTSKTLLENKKFQTLNDALEQKL
jgi:hypothetical protein